MSIQSLQVNGLNSLKSKSADELASVLKQLSHHYYNGTSLVNDDLFDAIQDLLREKSPDHPALQQVGAEVSGTSINITISNNNKKITNDKHRIKRKLPYWMGSMNKVKPESSSLKNWMNKYKGLYNLSDKMDGVSCLLVCQGDDQILYTRGDGTNGTDISFLIPYLKLPEIKSDMSVRGELIMSKNNYEKFKNQCPNARNLVSGIVNSKTIDPSIILYIDLIAYELIKPTNLKINEQFRKLKEYGFNLANSVDKSTISEEELIEYFTNRRKESEYEIDGIIISDTSQVHVRNTDGNPKYAVAFKMVNEVMETVVTNIEWKIQKDGYLFPVINIKPIFLSGVTIQNCSGKNAKFILDNCLGVGSQVEITRDGDVIPGIYKILSKSMSGEPQLPNPAEIPYTWSKNNVDIIMTDLENDEVSFKKILHFFKTLAIPYMAAGTIKKCMESGLRSIKDILNATVQDFLKLDGVQIKSAEKYYKSIHDTLQKINIVTMMAASNQFGRGLGSKKFDLLLENIPEAAEWKIDTNNKTDYIYEICKIKGFEVKTATQYVKKLPDFQEFLETLPEWVVHNIYNPYMKDPNSNEDLPKSENNQFKDMKVVFSGFRNKDWEELITKGGGTINNTVSKKTTLVVIKDKDSTSGKITKAKNMGIQIMDMVEFEKEYM